MELPHVPATATADDIHEVLARDGALVIDGLASHDVIDQIDAEMSPHIEATPTVPKTFLGSQHNEPVGWSPAR
jgi:hypothetical protein